MQHGFGLIGLAGFAQHDRVAVGDRQAHHRVLLLRALHDGPGFATGFERGLRTFGVEQAHGERIQIARGAIVIRPVDEPAQAHHAAPDVDRTLALVAFPQQLGLMS